MGNHNEKDMNKGGAQQPIKDKQGLDQNKQKQPGTHRDLNTPKGGEQPKQPFKKDDSSWKGKDK
jgi:hypothetical protein